MVKNENLINLVNNKKPIELVQELKDEYKVPSYEEFNRTYEIDEKVNDNYENEFDSKNDITVPYRYGPGNDQSKHTAAKVITGVALTGLTAICPPAGAAVAGGMVTTGAITLAATDEKDEHDAFARKLGRELLVTGATNVAAGVGGSFSHSGKSCPLPICPKK